MQDLFDLPVQQLSQQQDAGDLDATGGRPGAGAGEHEDHQQHLTKDRPLGKVRRGEAGGGHGGHGVEDGILQRPTQRNALLHHETGGDKADGPQRQQGIQPQLLAVQRRPDVSPQGDEDQREVDARQEHEDGHDPCDGRGAEGGNAGVAGGEATGGDGGKGVEHSLVKVHACQTQGHDLCRRQSNVDAIEYLGGVTDMGQQFALDGTGTLGPHQVYGPRPRPGHQGQKQHQHTHAAHPLGQRPPEEDTPWHGLHIRQDGGSGGGEARGRLEQGVSIVGDSPAEDVRHRPEQAQHDPRHGHHRIAVPALQTVLPGRDAGEDQPAQAAQPQRPQKRLPAGLTIACGHQQRQQQAPGFHPEGIAHDVQYQTKVHVTCPLHIP